MNRHGRMRGKLLGVLPVADGAGPEFDVSELTTWVSDALVLAPSMLLTPGVEWTPVDGTSFDVTVTDGDLMSTSRVTVDESGRLTDVWSEDRWATLPQGLTRARWSTPLDVRRAVSMMPTPVSATTRAPSRQHRR